MGSLFISALFITATLTDGLDRWDGWRSSGFESIRESSFQCIPLPVVLLVVPSVAVMTTNIIITSGLLSSPANYTHINKRDQRAIANRATEPANKQEWHSRQFSFSRNLNPVTSSEWEYNPICQSWDNNYPWHPVINNLLKWFRRCF